MLEQKRNRSKQWFATLRMSSKIMASGALMIFCSNLLILIVVCTVAIHSMRNQMEEQVLNQLNVTMSSVSGIIKDIGELMVTMSTAEDISEFSAGDYRTPAGYLADVNGINEKLRILKLSNSQVDYAALIREDLKEPLYIGHEITSRQIYERLLKDASNAEKDCQNGFFICLMQDFFREPKLNLFCPIFEKYSLTDSPIAYLVVGLNISDLAKNCLEESTGQRIRVLNTRGIILISNALGEIGLPRKYFLGDLESYRESENADFVSISRKSYQPDLIFEGTIDKDLWRKGITRTARGLALAIVIFTMLSIIVIYYLCNYFYEPMNEMLETMRSVRDGDIEKRMKQYEQADFGQIAETFNSMTDSLKNQMDMIRIKERENTEIRLNALQSQIKPHFLYNTLESIHMQSLLEGATGASKMIMALSHYYRLSLSKGAELIPLSQELGHMNSYVMIQNIRYDNILNMEIDIPEELLLFEIPKITLQPLVENVFYHGIKPKKERIGHVKLSGWLEDGYMILKISDDGIGMTEEQIRNLNDNINVLINDGSYGVKNVHTRLEIRYGYGSGLHYEKNQEGGITVTVRLPARKAI